MVVGGWWMFRELVRERPAVAHFHDPELIPWAMLLPFFGVRVIYDVHEDYPFAITENYRLPAIARRFLPPLVRLAEYLGASVFSAVVTVTPTIQRRFPKRKAVMVRNWPIAEEFAVAAPRPMAERSLLVVYVGTLTLNRNVWGMLEAMRLLGKADCRLELIGAFTVGSDEEHARTHPEWGRTGKPGWVSREEVAAFLAQARAGLVVLRPIPHEAESYPIKLFEYMAAGVPVIASDFPLWRETVGRFNCALFVDPDNHQQIADAIRWLIENPREADAMGARGRRAILEELSWETEAKVLVSVYENVLMGRSALMGVDAAGSAAARVR